MYRAARSSNGDPPAGAAGSLDTGAGAGAGAAGSGAAAAGGRAGAWGAAAGGGAQPPWGTIRPCWHSVSKSAAVTPATSRSHSLAGLPASIISSKLRAARDSGRARARISPRPASVLE
ncbi:MAG: hypothetical protein EOP39_01725 [Rubrivivax sp.]|nr:MAG: hypothetical protein EOP39_01725 [Rubrivivax sp.]